jgi:nucleotide-binding universal stress UspA family protein
MLPKIDTILLATGLGGGAPHVLRYALSLASQYQAKLEIVYGLEPLKPYAHYVAEIYIAEKKLDDFHQQAIARVTADIEEKVTAMVRAELDNGPGGYQPQLNVAVIEDLPDQAILRQANAVGASLIVMGTHQRMAEKGALMGSCAFKVLHAATVPVLIVRIPEQMSDFRRDPAKPAVLD